ncbi:MAG: DUF1501 domain-containing protein [Acidobacteriota bacterium]
MHAMPHEHTHAPTDPRPRASLTGNGDDPRAMVVIFLRGAADGLAMVAPVEDDAYHLARPTLGLGRSSGVRLDDQFHLHPELATLERSFRGGELAIVHAAGSEDQSRSHFAAQDLMEHGGLVAGGWLGRFLRARADGHAASALSAIAIGKTLPESLRGAPSATVIESIDDFGLGADAAGYLAGLDALWSLETGDLGHAARDTLDAVRRIERLRATPYTPAAGVDYPNTRFGRGLSEIARLIKARVGLEAATLDLDGWDSHLAQGSIMDPRLRQLGTGLVALHHDLGALAATTTIVVMTEFGRRVAENASLGTDHGRGSVMFVLGGGTQGGRVIADGADRPWRGLATEHLEGPGDLPVNNNYRNVLAPLLRRHGATNLEAVFPGWSAKPLAI